MHRSRFALATLLCFPASLSAQILSAGAARWLTSPHVSEYRLGIGGLDSKGLRLAWSGQLLQQADTSKAHWYGLGADVMLRTTPAAQPYFLAGVAVGAGRGVAGGGEQPGVGAWGGVGFELFTLGPVGMQAEAMYTWRSGVQLQGVVLGLRLGSRVGRDLTAPLPPAVLPTAAPSDEEILRLATAARRARAPAAEIVATALGAMGTPYRWGGTGSDGFDCSGLIQYAYQQHGISIPRRSRDQAEAGSEVGRDLLALMPGDILTFSADAGGSKVEHVGLYLGDGKFIHSARGGVQVSSLSESDPVGRWWFQRWVGARRVL